MNLAPYIDHTLLRPDATREEIRALCREAKEYGFQSVCINSKFVPLVHRELEGSHVKTCAVVGFPLGAMLSSAKAEEASLAVTFGAEEIDMVIDVGAVKEGDISAAEHDISAVVSAVHPHAIVKVIIEACLLTDEEKREACLAAKRAGADFVKTSTGFSRGGATEHDVKLMRETVGESMGVKAAGGIRDYETALRMIHAGANRIGASAGVKIVREGMEKSSAMGEL